MSKVAMSGPRDGRMLSFLRSHQASLESSHFLSMPYHFPLRSAKPAWALAFPVPTGSQPQADLELLIFLCGRHCTCFPLCWGPNSEVGCLPGQQFPRQLHTRMKIKMDWFMLIFHVAELKLHCLSYLSKHQCQEIRQQPNVSNRSVSSDNEISSA